MLPASILEAELPASVPRERTMSEKALVFTLLVASLTNVVCLYACL
jgi:hypothetical protein